MAADTAQDPAQDPAETAAHDHELEVLEDDQTVPPRPEEQIADVREDGTPEPAPDPAAAR